MEKQVQLEILSALVGPTADEFWEFGDRLNEFQFDYEPAKIIFRLLQSHWKRSPEIPSPGLIKTYLRHLRTKIGPDLFSLANDTVDYVFLEKNSTSSSREYVAEFIAANELKYFPDEISSLEMGGYRAYIASVQERFEKIAELERAKAEQPGLDPFSHSFLKNPSRKIKENYGGIPIGTGFKRFDTYIDPLYPGEFGLFIAPTGKGKSVYLVNLAWHACYDLRLRVVYFALDNLAAEFAERFHTRASGFDVKGARKNFPDEVVDTKIAERFYQRTNGEELRLHIRDFPRNTISVRDIKKYLRSMRRKWIREDKRAGLPEKEWGKVGLILVDYGDLMVLDRPTGHDWLDRERNYNDLAALGVDERCPVWSVSQTNTDGTKKSQGNAREWHAAGGMAKLSPVRVGCSMLQTPQEYLQGIFSCYVWKATRSQSGIVFPMRIRYSTQTIQERIDIEPWALAGGELKQGDTEDDGTKEAFRNEEPIDTDIFGNVEDFYTSKE